MPHNELEIPRNRPLEFIQAAIDQVNMQNILQPAFYQVLAGTFWEMPGQPGVATQNQVQIPKFVDPVTGKFDAAAALAFKLTLDTPADIKRFNDSLTTAAKRLGLPEEQKLKEQERRTRAPTQSQRQQPAQHQPPRRHRPARGPRLRPRRVRVYGQTIPRSSRRCTPVAQPASARAGNPRG